MRLPAALPINDLPEILLRIRNRHLLFVDVYLLPLAALLAFVLRLETLDFRPYALAIWIYVAAAPLIKVPILAAMGIYRRFWRYASADDAILLALAAFVASAAEGALFLGLLVPLGLLPGIPRSIPLIDAVLTLWCIGGTRFGLRIAVQRARRCRKAGAAQAPRRRVLIAGAGEAGVLVLKELTANPQTGLEPVGFVDDDPSKAGMRVYRYPVLGPCSRIPALVAEHKIDQVIIAMPSAPGRTIRDLVGICGAAGVAVRTLPGVYDVLAGRVNLEQIRDIQIEDLLRREPVSTDTSEVAQLIQGRRVLVTGAGGSIGSELCRQIARCAPAELILLGHGENSIFEIHNELSLLKSAGQIACELRPVIADIRFPERLAAVFGRYRPEMVFHAAAHKHVPLMETSPEDAISNNVEGTRNLLAAAMAAGVSHFVQISTDKAINPTSVMGATKRVAELMVQAAAQATGLCYVAVRFGNVLGSRGSVVPFFQRQIAAGGPVTVTHPDMRRYFMSIPEAVQLVLQAAALGDGGEVFVLDMGEPVRIVDLAADLIRLSGLEPVRDIEIAFTGLRPGEKLFEELFADQEAHTRTRHVKIFVSRNGHVQPDEDCNGAAALTLDGQLDLLIAAARRGEPDQVRCLLQAIVPEYCPTPSAGNPPASSAIDAPPVPERTHGQAPIPEGGDRPAGLLPPGRRLPSHAPGESRP